MSLWGNVDYGAANTRPKWVDNDPDITQLPGGNSLVVVATSAYLNSGNGSSRPAHAGWQVVRVGTGGIATISVNVGGGGYTANSNGFITFVGGGGGNANAQWFANANGIITTVSLKAPGDTFNVAPQAFANTANATNATFILTLGGRAGRVFAETLVAGGTFTSQNPAANTYFKP